MRAPILTVALLLIPCVLRAQQPRALSLEEAVSLATGTSEQLVVARAGVARAEANVDRLESQTRPQVNGTLSYQRTLASQFEGISGGAEPDVPPECIGPFDPDPDLPVEERVALLERRLACPPSSGFGGIDFSQLGFGAPNTWNLGLALNWPVYTGGRIEAQTRAAEALAGAAEAGIGASEAQAIVDVTAAYFDAQLASELVEIAEASLAQAEETHRLTAIRAREGAQPEFEVLQARVTRDNQRPRLIRASTTRELAYDRLRALLDLPQDQPLILTTPIADADVTIEDASVDALERTPVRQAAARLEAASEQLRAARAQRKPSASLQSLYGLTAFSDSVIPDTGDFRDDWTVGAVVQIPIYDGGRIKADVAAARADVAEAEAQLDLIMELAELDTRSALSELRNAVATYEATEGTVEQARRGYELAQLRFREGISISLEVQNARLLLEQARANRAQAARDVRVARTRVALLRSLPLAGAGFPETPQPSQQSFTPPAQVQPSSPVANPFGGFR